MTTGKRIELDGVCKRYGHDEVLQPTSLAIGAGELLAVLGPSGCGKTTLLGIVAGLVTPTSGDVRLDGRSLAGLPPERRGIPMVFQDHLLFPGMSVRDNVAFGLRMRRTEAREREARVDEALAEVRLEAHGAKYPAQLSGGQRQRVALARAIVLRPAALLLDEPFSSLDTALRQGVRELVLEMRQRFGFTGILVTHDPEEALGMADRVAVLRAGRVERCAPPRELWRDPGTRFVAGFLGEASFLRARRDGGAVELGDGTRVEAPTGGVEAGAFLCLRPEAVRIAASGDAGLAAVVRQTFFSGATVTARLDTAAGELRWRGRAESLEAMLVREVGASVRVRWDAGEAVLVSE